MLKIALSKQSLRQRLHDNFGFLRRFAYLNWRLLQRTTRYRGLQLLHWRLLLLLLRHQLLLHRARLDWSQWRRVCGRSFVRRVWLIGLYREIDLGGPEDALFSSRSLSWNRNVKLLNIHLIQNALQKKKSYAIDIPIPLSSCCLTCCCTAASCCGVKSAPCSPCSTILGPCWVCITWAVTHLMTVPGGWPASKWSIVALSIWLSGWAGFWGVFCTDCGWEIWGVWAG